MSVHSQNTDGGIVKPIEVTGAPVIEVRPTSAVGKRSRRFQQALYDGKFMTAGRIAAQAGPAGLDNSRSFLSRPSSPLALALSISLRRPGLGAERAGKLAAGLFDVVVATGGLTREMALMRLSTCGLVTEDRWDLNALGIALRTSAESGQSILERLMASPHFSDRDWYEFAPPHGQTIQEFICLLMLSVGGFSFSFSIKTRDVIDSNIAALIGRLPPSQVEACCRDTSQRGPLYLAAIRSYVKTFRSLWANPMVVDLYTLPQSPLEIGLRHMAVHAVRAEIVETIAAGREKVAIYSQLLIFYLHLSLTHFPHPLLFLVSAHLI
jgi:hypothetical protein